MSVNKYKPHVMVLPEDDANRQIANGFILEVNARKIQVLPEVGGWINVCEIFTLEHVAAMYAYPHRYIILLLDFDEDLNRQHQVKARVPDDLKDRVFLLGVRSEPEALRRAKLGSYEDIGRTMAHECQGRKRHIWTHELLRHNANELTRLEQAIRSFLF